MLAFILGLIIGGFMGWLLAIIFVASSLNN